MAAFIFNVLPPFPFRTRAVRAVHVIVFSTLPLTGRRGFLHLHTMASVKIASLFLKTLSKPSELRLREGAEEQRKVY